MAQITFRLTQGTYALLRRAAAARLCDQNDILESAVKAFAARSFQMTKPKRKSSLFPPPPSSPDSLIFSSNQRRYRRTWDIPPRKVTTTVSDAVVTLLHKLAGKRAGIGDAAERALRFYLWDEQKKERNEYARFIHPVIFFEDWKALLLF